MSEYPKVIVVDGIKITARDADDEARWRFKPEIPIQTREPEPEPAPPVVVPKKKAKSKKK